MPLVGVVLNRVHMWPGGGELPSALEPGRSHAAEVQLLARALLEARPAAEADPAALEQAESCALEAVEAATSYASLVRLDARCAVSIRDRARAAGCFFRQVPELSHDVHDLQSLAVVERHLLGAGPENGAGGA